MKLLLLALLLLCLGPASARTAFQARCEDSLGEVSPAISIQQPGYRIDNSLSYRSLTVMKGPAPAGSYVLGLTRTESRVSISVASGLLADRETGYECIAPRLQVSLFYVPIVIYVGREFTPGSCAYQEILAHEMRHLKTYLEHLPKVENVVRNGIVIRFGGRPMYAPAGQARALLQRELDSRWMPYIKGEMAKAEALQAAIDTPQEYARLSKVCKGEVQSLIGSAKRTRS
jgi:hypothetical protein